MIRPSSFTKHRFADMISGNIVRIGLCTALAGLPGITHADQTTAPLEFHPTQLFKFETANQLPARGLSIHFGTTQSDPHGAGGGTGNQIYYLGGAYAPSDRLTFGFDAAYYEDPVIKPINGLRPSIGMDSAALSAKYQLYNSGPLKVSGLASVEFFRFESDLAGTISGPGAKQTIGALQLPITYELSRAFQVHLTPGVSVFPSTMNGKAFYGTVGYIGLGASLKPNERLAFYGAVNVPVSGGNTFSDTATITKVPVWTVGGRFNVTPKVALDLYATNGIGTTPATSILTFWPNGDTPLIGAKITFTPGRGERYQPSYRTVRQLSSRELRLQQDGFTLGSADTRDPGDFAAAAWYGSAKNAGVGAALGIEQDFQLEGYIERYAEDGSVPAVRIPSKDPRYMLGGKLRFMDQNNGDPLSLSLRVLGGRVIGAGTPGPGVIYVDVSSSYTVSPQLTLTAGPRFAAFGKQETFGMGFGANYELYQGLDVIGEVTAMGKGEPTVWAAGARYNVPNTPFSVDVSASNAIGRYGLGTLVAQDDVKYAIGLSTKFNIRGLRP